MSKLTIVDLHQEEELSSSSAAKVAGGITPAEAQDFLDSAADSFSKVGFKDAADYLSFQALCVAQGTTIPC